MQNPSATEMPKIIINSARPILLTLFMLTLTAVTFVLGEVPAAVFFAIITLALSVTVYKKITNELVRAQFGQYRINW